MNIEDIDKTIAPQRFGEKREKGRFQVGDVIMGRYTVLTELGQGGMGVVYKCLDTTGKINVALKALPPELSHNSLEMEDIRDNFALVEKLHHPSIANVKQLERDPASGDYYLIMECVEGENLKSWIRRERKSGDLTVERISPVIRQVAEALDYAHSQKVIHRDIKPGNIMIGEDGTVKVLDFGLAAEIHTSMTRVSMAYYGTSGTGPYMAPEQWRGKRQGEPADQYALAVTAYEMLAGRQPFESADAAVLREAVLNETPDPIPGLSSSAQNAISRAMSKDPVARFASCAEFAAALSGKRTPHSGFPTISKQRRKLLLILVLLLLGGVFIYRQLESRREAELKAVAAEARRQQEETERIRRQQAEAQRQAEAKERSRPQEQVRASAQRPADFTGTVMLPGDVKLELVKIKAGGFIMGSPEGELGRFSDEEQHQVTLTKDFWLGKYEVTQSQYETLMGTNPSSFTGANLPVENVSWVDAMAFCRKLNERYRDRLPAGYEFTLPTEAQWEYACRAGTTTALNSGKDLSNETYHCENLRELGWYGYNNAENSTHPVGQKKPNAWGLYDMHGNAWEWCRDWYGSYAGAATDPTGPTTGSFRVCRGGSWIINARSCRSAFRSHISPGYRHNALGFRLALASVQ
jgi:formylglycine-generating enzyme required for sulfatase activity/predicted Ser/Thr protein kinase